LSVVYRNYDWWAYLFRVRHRRLIPDIADYDRKLARFVWEVLGLSSGSAVFDAGCGAGTQALEFARLGAVVTGWDIAPSLIRHAHGLNGAEGVVFHVADMMSLSAVDTFDAVVLLSSTFGLLSDGAGFLERARNALRPGGAVLIESANALRYGVDVQESTIELDELQLTFSTVFRGARNMLETRFYARQPDGAVVRFRRNPGEPDESVKLHSPEELRALAAETGFELEAVYGDIELPPWPFESDSPKVIAVLSKLN